MGLEMLENIVQLFDFFTDSKNYYMVCQYCGYGNLFDAIVHNQIKSDLQASKIFYQIVSAVHHCHSRGVAHRDLKCHNILFDQLGRAKVGDFGFCAFINEDEKLKTCCGTPCYASPECIQNQKYDAKKSDIWSLGVILYEMLTGNQPWNHSNTPLLIKSIINAQFTIPPGCPHQASELIKWMLKLNPKERPTTEEILKYPWVKKGAPLIGISSIIPKTYSSNAFNTSKLLFLQNSIKRRESDKINGVVSPFKDLPGSPLSGKGRDTRFTESHRMNPPKVISPIVSPRPVNSFLHSVRREEKRTSLNLKFRTNLK